MGKKKGMMKKILILLLMVSVVLMLSNNVEAVTRGGGGDDGYCDGTGTVHINCLTLSSSEIKCSFYCTPIHYCNGVEPFVDGTISYDGCSYWPYNYCGCTGSVYPPDCNGKDERNIEVKCTDIRHQDLCTSPCTWTVGGGGRGGTCPGPVVRTNMMGCKDPEFPNGGIPAPYYTCPSSLVCFFCGENYLYSGSQCKPICYPNIAQNVAGCHASAPPNTQQTSTRICPNANDNCYVCASGYKWNGTECAPTNNAQCININAPDNVLTGQQFLATVTMKNTGTKIWTTANYKLGSQNPQDNTRWGLSRVTLPNDVSQNQEVTFSFNPTAPGDTGNQFFDWKMLEEGLEWFGETCTKPIEVCGGCLIGGTCYSDGIANLLNLCQYCDISKSRTGWSNYDDTHACTILGCGGRCNGEGTCVDQGPTVPSDRFTGPCTPSALAYACTESDRENELVSSKVWVGKCSGTCDDLEWNYINNMPMNPAQGRNQEYVSNNFNLVKDLAKPKLVADCKLEEVCNPSKVATSRRMCDVDCAGSGPQLSSPAATNVLGPDLGISTITFLSPFNDLNPLTDIQVEVTPGGSGVGRGELGGLGGMNPTYNARFVRIELAGVNYRYVYEFDVLNTYKTGTADVLITATRQGCSGSISTQFQLYYCVINSASIFASCSANGCNNGDNVDLFVTLSGDCSYYNINFLQIDGSSTQPIQGGEAGFIGLKPKMIDENKINSEDFAGGSPEPPRSADGVCNIQLTDSYLIDVLGMNNDATIPPGFIQNQVVSIQWTIPNWKDVFAKEDCSAKTIYPTAVGLYYKAIGLPPLYVGKVFFNSPTGSFVFKDLNTNMLCGKVVKESQPPYTELNKTCNDTQPPDKKTICTNFDDCVYANEDNGQNSTCYIRTSSTTNKEGKEIICQDQQHWCPKGFLYSPAEGYCIFGTLKCDEGYESQLICNKFPPTFPFNLTKPCLFTQLGKYTQGCCFVSEWSGYKIYATQNVKIY